jgi:prepilin-type N-terminal cleavage/methylation domain-containing protein
MRSIDVAVLMKQRRNSGFTLPELLAAVMIVAMLMASLALALQGVLHAYTEDSKIAQATQATRVVLNRMMAEVRTAKETSSSATFLSILPHDNVQGTTEIQYEMVNGALVRRQIGGTAASTVDLIAANELVRVTSFNVTRTAGVDSHGVACTKSVTVDLGIQVDNNSMQTTASAALRKNMTY